MSARVAVVTGAASGIGLGHCAAAGCRRHGGGVARPRRRPVPRCAAAELAGAGRHGHRLRGRRGRSRRARRRSSPRCARSSGPSRSSSPAPGSSRSTRSSRSRRRSGTGFSAVNLTGTFTACSSPCRTWSRAGWGRIVTISSSSAQSGAPNMAHYVASKGGVIGLTKAFARELARHRHHGEHHPADHRRHADGPEVRSRRATSRASRSWAGWSLSAGRDTPEDIASVCAYLCSDEAGYITGQVIGVNGGMYI